jgi:DNA-binding beta-propeller fold protein YncE
MALLQIALLTSGVVSVSSAQSDWKVVNRFNVGGVGAWDYLTVDPPNHRLFVTRTSHTMAIDERTGQVLGDIRGQVHSHGVALAPEFNRGFITDGGGPGAIIVFDLKTYAVLGKIPAMPDADGIIYDAKLKKILAVSGDGNSLLSFSPDISPKGGKLDPPIKLGGAPEFFVSDGSGNVYINLEDKNMVAVVNLKTHKVKSRWPVAPGGQPVAMAMDMSNHRLFIGCRNPQKLIVMSSETGTIEASVPIGAGVDAGRFDAGLAFASAGDGSMTVAALKSGTWSVVQTVKTAAGARTMDVDPGTHHIFLPTAELEQATNGRPRPKAGTFMIIEVGR